MRALACTDDFPAAMAHEEVLDLPLDPPSGHHVTHDDRKLDATGSRNYRGYTADGTYWTGRKTANGGIEVLRLRAGTYEIVESFDTFQRLGAAVGAAARLAYLQGWRDAQAELSHKVLASLADVGIRPITIPDEGTAAGSVDTG